MRELSRHGFAEAGLGASGGGSAASARQSKARPQIIRSGRIFARSEQELREKRLVTLPFDAPWLSLDYGFITKRGRTLSPAALAFMETVRTIERDIGM